MNVPLRVVYVHPQIPGNTGSTIRLSALTGCELHLVEPLGFDLDGAKLRRAGLDYHDMANVHVHPDLDTALAAVQPTRLFALTARASTRYCDVAFADGDVAMFGCESTGLADDVLVDPRVTAQLRIPMLAGRRSLNLASATAVIVYEAWRQLGFGGAHLVG